MEDLLSKYEKRIVYLEKMYTRMCSKFVDLEDKVNYMMQERVESSKVNPEILSTTDNQSLFAAVPREIILKMALTFAKCHTLSNIGLLFETKYGFCIGVSDAQALCGRNTPMRIMECILIEIQKRGVTKADFLEALKSTNMLEIVDMFEEYLK